MTGWIVLTCIAGVIAGFAALFAAAERWLRGTVAWPAGLVRGCLLALVMPLGLAFAYSLEAAGQDYQSRQFAVMRSAELESQLHTAHQEYERLIQKWQQTQRELTAERTVSINQRSDFIQQVLAAKQEASELRMYVLREKRHLFSDAEVLALVEQEERFRAKMVEVKSILDRSRTLDD